MLRKHTRNFGMSCEVRCALARGRVVFVCTCPPDCATRFNTMEVTLTAAHKVRRLPFIDGINAFGSPTESFPSCGEGSSFLAVPTKRNTQPSDPPSTTVVSKVSTLVAKLTQSSTTDSKAKDKKTYLDFRDVLAGYFPSHRRDSNVTFVSARNGCDKDDPFYQLNQLRIHAGAPERSERGVEKLMRYFAQLCYLEDHVPFDTEDVCVFSWYETFFHRKTVSSPDLQFEKAAVLWNIGALYSQLGAVQTLWNQEGLKLAALYFQRAAGAFLHIRETLVPRLRMKVDPMSDMTESTLTTVIELMLAQAAECYFQKAEFDNTSSPVTSQIAIHAADFYDVAYRAAKSNGTLGKMRIPKVWVTHLRTKNLVLTSLSHLHCPNSMDEEVAVGERYARLLFAKELAESALEKCVVKDAASIPELRVMAANALDRITRALNDIDKANYEEFHQTVVSRDMLHRLRRPPQSLVSSIDVVRGVNCSSIWDHVRENKFLDLFKTIEQDRRESNVTYVSESDTNVNVNRHFSTNNINNAHVNETSTPTKLTTSVQVCQNCESRRESHRPSLASIYTSRMVSTGNVISDDVQNDISVFLNQVESSYDRYFTELEVMQKHALESIHASFHLDVSESDLLKSRFLDSKPPLKELILRARFMLEQYEELQQKEQACPLSSDYNELVSIHKAISTRLKEIQNELWDDGFQVKEKISQGETVGDVLQLRKLIRTLAGEWFEGARAVDETSVFEIATIQDVYVRLLSAYETEGISELFANGSDDETAWTKEKIRVVVPCLHDKLESESQKFVNLVAKQAELNAQLFQNAAADGSFVNMLIRLIKDVHELKEQINVFLSNDLMTLKTNLQNDYRKWAALQNNQESVVDELLRLSQNYGDKRSQGASVGLAIAKNNWQNTIDSIKKSLTVLNELLASLQGTVSVLNAPSRFNTSGATESFLSFMIQVQNESIGIVETFENQIKLWSSWREDCRQEVARMMNFQKWLNQTFPQTSQKNYRKMTFQRQSSTVPHFSTTAEDEFSLQEQMRDVPVETTKPRLPKRDSHFAGSENRQNMMRNLSMTAAKIQRQVSDIDYQHVDQNIYQQLFSELRKLQHQQDEFFKLHNTQMEKLNEERRNSRELKSSDKHRSYLINKTEQRRPTYDQQLEDSKKIASRKNSTFDKGVKEHLVQFTHAQTTKPSYNQKTSLEALIKENFMLKEKTKSSRLPKEVSTPPLQSAPVSAAASRRTSKNVISRKPVTFATVERTEMYDDDHVTPIKTDRIIKKRQSLVEFNQPQTSFEPKEHICCAGSRQYSAAPTPTIPTTTTITISTSAPNDQVRIIADGNVSASAPVSRRVSKQFVQVPIVENVPSSQDEASRPASRRVSKQVAPTQTLRNETTNLRDTMQSVSNFIAWRRDDYDERRRGSVAVEPYIP